MVDRAVVVAGAPLPRKAIALRNMPRELRIHVDVDAAGRYEFRMSSGRREITTNVNPDLAASFFDTGGHHHQ